MKRVLCPTLPSPDQPVELPSEEARHLTQVLRLSDGASVEAMDGAGHAVLGTLRIRGKRTLLEFQRAIESVAHEPGLVPVTLEISILKGEAMEWVVEKAVELGIRSLVPVITAHTVVQLDRKGPEVFRARWQKIADQALKQCGRRHRLEVREPIELEQLLAREAHTDQEPRLWCDEASRVGSMPLARELERIASPCRILIGPEGGFSEIERQLLPTSSVAVSLGPLVLRAETAAIAAMSLASARFYARELDKKAQKPES
jgi:16S rRNA (uracil1498-N3)-methyltransferase